MLAAKHRGRVRPLDDAARRAAPGGFLRLGNGFTHFESAGPHTARPVVLVHGFSVPSWVWDPTYSALATAGFRAVRYDLYGRGFSARPDLDYTIDLFVQQLSDLLDELSMEQLDLVGLSMGGPIVATFATRYPRKVRRIVLIDPSGAKSMPLGALALLSLYPKLGAAAFQLIGSEYLVRTIARDFFTPDLIRVFQERYRAQMQYDGFIPAVLSTVRNRMLGDFSSTYAELGRGSKPILVFWGEHDRTIPVSHFGILRNLLPGAEFNSVPGTGHLPHYERPEAVQPRLISFLHE